MAAAFDTGSFESTAFEIGGGGGASYTMPCDTGVYSITGNNASLGATHRMLADQGSYSITGNAATLTYTPVGLSMPAEAGTYALTGNAVNLLNNHRLIADNGTYSISGSAVVDPGTPAPATGDGGGAGDIREVRRFAELLSKPSKEAKKKRRKIIETAVLELLPNEPEAKQAAQHIAKVIVRQEVSAIARWTPERAMMPIARPQLSYDAHEAIMRMVADWLANEQARRELEDEEDAMLLLN